MEEEELFMKQYTGTKTVKACRMSRVAAEEIIGRKIYDDDRENEVGYLIEYADGYKSWSPAKAFEDAYRPSETYLDRMKIEMEEVSERYLNGRKFTFTQEFRNLDSYQAKLLLEQLHEMEGYLYALSERIAYAECGIVTTDTNAKSPSCSK